MSPCVRLCVRLFVLYFYVPPGGETREWWRVLVFSSRGFLCPLVWVWALLAALETTGGISDLEVPRVVPTTLLLIQQMLLFSLPFPEPFKLLTAVHLFLPRWEVRLGLDDLVSPASTFPWLLRCTGFGLEHFINHAVLLWSKTGLVRCCFLIASITVLGDIIPEDGALRLSTKK